ncbi:MULTISPECIES: inositol monophosphatase family protein [Roseobacter]|uniref:Inositol-1-monophosphatase n=1 Tax=Roseobacter litoralis (strain ATCC 49566 / DSM 6996 / JCM 21268 / NBRC 15278 / OCh 149) TaxID=391595 RepID=F7ZDJ5_ROSLO|nr:MULTISPECIES: inositol monophosphatase [Roseobacter]AEI94597.1 putative inositol monophosphatase [Roseobacter litoralis Och 149]GIT88021.1 arabinose phosphate phosphatase [Roseobacter sp. OBYS 0001]
MTLTVSDDEASKIERLARDAGALALSHFRTLATVSVESKGHLDLVTAADQEVEAFITKRLIRDFPDDGVFGEEGAAHQGTSGRTWVIDPIDGTFNFVRGGDQWAISIGLYQGGRPSFGVIHAPVRDQTLVGGDGVPATLNGVPMAARAGLDENRAACGVGFHPVIPVAQRLHTLQFVLEDARMSFRCCGSATISLIEVALGQVDGYLGTGESTWDLMAALPILEQIGIVSTVDWSAIELNAKIRFACGTPEFLEAVAPIVPFGATL